ncbi:unnamed protein product [Rotaria sordida]|uniref:Leucine-rich repeat-containing protein n=1 Tax=Rotaria sordida TaxID=392033 RepID=A0A814SL74_9BILA|nr:unnamed protein product [Rotaria sordida]
MKAPIRVPLNRNNHDEEKSNYANFNNTRIITLFQVPQYEQLQILICNGNSLTTLAGVEHIKHLWKLDVGNNQIRSLQHLSRFIALGSLILSNNRLQWIELQHIRHMFILDLRLDGNTILDADSNYRQHVLDCLPRIWMCDGIFVSTSERNQVDEFFTQSSLAQKPVRHKLARDIFMPTNLKDRAINGLFGSKATELFAKFPMNCFVNSELDKRRIKHLAATIQDLLLTEMRNDEGKKHDEFLMENRHILYHMVDIRENHVEEFNMCLILLVTHMLFEIPVELLNNVFDITHIKSIGNLNIDHIFSSSEELKSMIASLIHAGTRLDRDENHPSAFNDKLFNSLSIVITNQLRQLSTLNTSQPYPNGSIVSEAKSMVCLEVMQILIMCPLFYTLIDNPNVNSILKQALDRSPAYGSIKDVLKNLTADEKSAEEQKDLLSPILGNILKMTMRTLSTKKTKKINEPLQVETTKPEQDNSNKRQQERILSSPKSSQRAPIHRIPTIGDRILTAPQTFARIVTIPDGDIAMIQFDHILAVNGSMIKNGSLNDHTNYVSMNNFEWDASHDYWRPKFALGDKITLHMATIREETSRNLPLPRALPSKTLESIEKKRPIPKLFEINLNNKPKEAFVEPPPVSNINHEENNNSQQNPTIENQVITTEEIIIERPMSVRIIKQKQEQQNKDLTTNETISSSPILIESTLFLMPDQSQPPISSIDQQQQQQQSFTTSTIVHDFERSSSASRRTTTTNRIHVPVHNASQWFNGPNMQNERSGRMEKIISSLVRRSFRPISDNTMPRVPTLTSPSSREHALSKGFRPGTLQDFCIESQRMVPTPFMFNRQSQSTKNRYAPSTRSYDLSRSNEGGFRIKCLFNPPCPTPSWM